MAAECLSRAKEEQGNETGCTLDVMLRPLALLLVHLVLFGCDRNGIPVDGGVDAGLGGGTIGSCATGFCISAIDLAPQGILAASVPQHAVAMKADGTIGIAYFRNATGANIDIVYVERAANGNMGTPTTVVT